MTSTDYKIERRKGFAFCKICGFLTYDVDDYVNSYEIHLEKCRTPTGRWVERGIEEIEI